MDSIKPSALEEAYQYIFSLPEGKLVLQDLLRAHCVAESTYTNMTDSPTIVAYREGGRNAVLRILALSGKSITFTE